MSVGNARSDRLVRSGPECSPGGGIRGRIVCAACDGALENDDAENGLSIWLDCCRRRNGCRFDIDDDESCSSAWHDGVCNRPRDFMANSSNLSDVLQLRNKLGVGARDEEVGRCGSRMIAERRCCLDECRGKEIRHEPTV